MQKLLQPHYGISRSFVCSVIASVALYLMQAMGGVHITLASIAIGVAATFILPGLVAFIYRKIKTFLNPLYHIPKMITTKASHIQPGDILNIPDNHDDIVQSVRKVPRIKASGFVHLQIVHFQCSRIFAARTMEKEQ